MRITQQQVTLYIEVLLATAALVFGSYLVASGLGQPVEISLYYGSAAIVGVLFVATKRGWPYASLLFLIVMTIVFGAAPSSAQLLDSSVFTGFLIPPLVAMIVGRPFWIPICALLGPVIFAVTGPFGYFLVAQNIGVYLTYLLAVVIIVLGRIVTDTALNNARTSAHHAVEALKLAEQQTQQLEAAKAQQETQLEQQQRLLDLVTTLETPAVTLADDVLFAPIVGFLDSRRAQALTRRLLELAHLRRARLVILDITGVAAIDGATAEALIATTRALRLLGCAVTLSGISAAVAQTLTAQGIDFAGIATVRSPQEALAHAAGLLRNDEAPRTM